MRDLVDELLQAKVKATLFGGDHAPRLGRLIILERIGSGAMGTVFAAYDPTLDRKVAVKLIAPGAEDRERVIREARALGKLAHPNVVAVHDVGELDGEIYIVMELVAGVPLRTWITGDRDWRDVVRVMGEAAAGLAAAHRAGLVHRDIKPDNILIGHDRARIVDFGLAHDQTGGDDGKSAGTPSYMAPEVLDERAATAASDQFSFGVTLYETLYGVRPHQGRTRAELRETAKLAASARPVKSTPPPAIDANASTDEPASRRTTSPRGRAADVDANGATEAGPGLLARNVVETDPPPDLDPTSGSGSASGPGSASVPGSGSGSASVPGSDAAAAPRTSPAASGTDVRDAERESSSSVLARTSGSLARAARAVRSAPPGWLHAIVVRALAADPLRRFPSMAELAAALGRDRRRRNRVIALVAAGALAGAALGVVAVRHRAVGDPCGGGTERRGAVWTAPATVKVKRALGTAVWTAKAIEGLDATAAQWELSYRNVCEATRVRGEQSDTLLDLRMRCLDRALDRFGALTVALSAPLDGPSRAEAIGAIAALPDPVACEKLVDPGELALPADPAGRARVTEAEHTLDRAWAEYELGHYAAAGDTLKAIANTQEMGAPALHAASLLLDAAIEGRIGIPAAAHGLLDSAMIAAAAAKAPELEAQVWTRLLRHELFAGAPAKVIEWSTFALAAATRAGHEGAEIEGIVGEAMRDAGNLAGARVHLAKALASKDPLRGEQRALLEMNVGAVELAAGLPGAAEPALQRALVLARGALGEDHPTLAIYLDKLAAADRARGHLRDALALHDQSLALRTTAFGKSDRSVATSLLGRARTLLEANRVDEASRDAATALEIRTAVFGAASPRLGEVIALQGDLALAANDLVTARDLYGRAATIDPRLELVARRAAAGAVITLDDLPTAVDPLTIDRAAALAVRVPLLPPEQGRGLAFALRTRIAGPGPFDPALTLPIADALLAIGDRAAAAEIATRTLGQLGDEPSRSRDRARRLIAPP